MSTLARFRRDDEAGSTLVELLITMIILGMLTAVMASLSIFGQRTARNVTTRLDNNDQAQLAMRTVARKLRTAIAPIPSSQTSVAPSPVAGSPFCNAGANDVTFYANLDTNPVTNPNSLPSLVRYWVDSSVLNRPVLKEQTWLPGATSFARCDYSNAGPTVTRTVGAGVVTSAFFTPATGEPALKPLFQYYKDDNVNGAGTSTLLSTSSGKLSDTDSVSVDRIVISIAVDEFSGSDQPSTRTQTTVYLPNGSTS